mmetsp:Transcript_20021/g.33035  ORF Transcript_20021/g.33035 Transcript_20021/m.33035 type:complete len:165 (-) Transcript_20021:38-532(-)
MSVIVTTTCESGSRIFAEEGDTVYAHYRGCLASSGEEFDSNFGSEKPLKFTIGLGQVIVGWERGFQQISLNSKATIRIPAELGYGEHGYPDDKGGFAIPPNSDLVFDVELVGIDKLRVKKKKETVELTAEQKKAVDDSWAVDDLVGSGSSKKKNGGKKKKKKKK